VETFTLLDHRFWLSGQGVAGHHPAMAERDLGLSQHPAGHVAELGLALPREGSSSRALSLGLSSYFRCGIRKGLLSAVPYFIRGGYMGVGCCSASCAWNIAQSPECGNTLVVQRESEQPGREHAEMSSKKHWLRREVGELERDRGCWHGGAEAVRAGLGSLGAKGG